MTDQEYLLGILKLQELEDDSPEMKELRRQRDKVEALLRENFDSPRIRYGGSKAKGTLNKESYDLDLTCYFPRDDNSAGSTLKEIFEAVESALQGKYAVRRKGSAVRLLDALDSGDSHVDVVPGRFVDGDDGDVFLYSSSGEKERLKTNLDVHIEHVRESGVVDAIRLMKLWKERRGIPVKTFAIELLTIDLLQGRTAHGLPEQLRHVFAQVRDNADSITIKDPANPEGNDLSELLDAGVRSRLRQECRDTLVTLETVGWAGVFASAEPRPDRERAAGVLTKVALSSPVPAKPWCAR